MNSVQFSWPVAALVFATCVAGCGGSDPEPDNPDTTGTPNQTSGPAPGADVNNGPVGNADLNGTWSNGLCTLDDQDPVTGESVYSEESLEVSDDVSMLTINYFSDSDCSVPTTPANEVFTSSLAFPEGTVEVPSFGTARFVNATIESITIDGVPFNGALINSVEYDIFLVTADRQLYFGDTDVPGQEGTSPETRPRTLDTDSPMTSR